MQMQDVWMVRRLLGRAVVVACVAIATLAAASTALANAPNPIPGTTKVDSLVVNPDGSRTITVQGQWTWVASNEPNCPADRNGVGYQVAWFDGNTANPIGGGPGGPGSGSPSGVLYIGGPTDNIVHSVETLGGSSAYGNAFYDGAPSSYIAHAASNPTPNSTDAASWVSNCGTTTSAGSTGTWGPISHTYPASFTGPITLCPIMYDPHGTPQDKGGGGSKVGDITAGGAGHNGDNSYEGNGVDDSCLKYTVYAPTLTTMAASGTVGQALEDTATLTGSGGISGTISWNVYAAGDTTCATPLNASSLTVSTHGDGTYTSPGFTPSSAGRYRWVATYMSTSGTAVTSCSDPNELSTVSPASPAIVTDASSADLGQPIHDTAMLSGAYSATGTITWTVYAASDTRCATPLYTVSDPVNGDGTYVSPSRTPSATGQYQWLARYSGDANNQAVSTACGDPNEVSTVQQAPAPSIALVKLERLGATAAYTHGPITGNVGDTVEYQMTVINTGNTPLAITFSDNGCDAGTLSGPVLLAGTYDAASHDLSAGGGLQYTCSHVLSAGDAPGYTNTATVSGQPPSGAPVSASDSVVANLNLPAIHMVKLQRVGSSGSFTTSPVTGLVGQTVEYEIQVTNTGNTPLTLTLSDPLCDAGTVSGPVQIAPTLSGDVLLPGGMAQYTCSHRLTPGDSSPFINTATVVGQPPTGPPVSGTSSVTANKQAVSPITIVRCGHGKVKTTKKVHGRKVTVCVAKKHVHIKRKRKLPHFTG
jgi:uncharacterized repeat protein (TIGR01451 family)